MITVPATLQASATSALTQDLYGAGSPPRISVLRLLVVGTLLSALLGCRGPAEDRVCTHMLDVLGSTDVISCTESMKTVHKRMGRLRYRAYARCVLRTETARAIIECRSNIE